MKRIYKLGLICLVMVATISLTLAENATFPWKVTGGEVAVGQQLPVSQGEITYSQVNDETSTWSNTLSNIPLSLEWYCRLTTQEAYSGDVTVDWTLETSTDQGWTWTDTGFGMTTYVTLSGVVGEIVYASADGTITGNYNWGQHSTAKALYRVRAVVNPPPVGLFESGYETGLSEWDGKHVWTGTLSIVTAPIHDGTYSCRSETTGRWGRAMAFKRLSLTGEQLVYVRIYVQFQTLPELNTNMYPIYIYDMENWKQFVGVFARNMNGEIVWIMNYGNGGRWSYTRSAPKGPSLGVWHSVEVMLKTGSGDGEVRLFVDGEELLSATGLDNTMFGEINGVLVGLGEGPGIVVVDCVEISSAYIGPE